MKRHNEINFPEDIKQKLPLGAVNVLNKLNTYSKDKEALNCFIDGYLEALVTMKVLTIKEADRAAEVIKPFYGIYGY